MKIPEDVILDKEIDIIGQDRAVERNTKHVHEGVEIDLLDRVQKSSLNTDCRTPD